MSFGISSRFPKFHLYSPSPNSYNLNFNNQEASNESWMLLPQKPNFKCDDNCSTCKCSKCSQGRFSHRESLGPCTHHQNHEPRHSLAVNKENLESSQRSLIPVKKALKPVGNSSTEDASLRGPSFLTRPPILHDCLNKQNHKEVFNRHAATRKAIKSVKRETNNTQSSSEDSLETKLRRTRLFASYTVLPKVGEEGEARGAVPKRKLNDTSHTNANENRQGTSKTISENTSWALLKQKDNELLKELSNNDRGMKYYHLATSTESSSSEDCNVVFLIGEEFLDDDLDSYIKSEEEERAVPSKDFLEMTSSLVRLWRHMENSEKVSFKVKSKKKKKTNKKKAVQQRVDVEAVVREAINGLRGEFLKNIYDTTNTKMDQLLLELRLLVLKANADVDRACEHTTMSLISRLRQFHLN